MGNSYIHTYTLHIRSYIHYLEKQQKSIYWGNGDKIRLKSMVEKEREKGNKQSNIYIMEKSQNSHTDR